MAAFQLRFFQVVWAVLIVHTIYILLLLWCVCKLLGRDNHEFPAYTSQCIYLA